jgi:hypothetical protein
MRVVEFQPPEYAEIPDNQPVLFLAGPIQGAPFWQKEIIRYLQTPDRTDEVVHVTNPRRDGPLEGNFGEEKYLEQVTWEEFYLLRAAEFGGIIFWFAKKDPSQPYEPGRAYAQTTRIELGEALGWKRYKPSINITIGIEPGYSGSERYIRFKARQHNLKVYSHIGDTCLDALRKMGLHG